MSRVGCAILGGFTCLSWFQPSFGSGWKSTPLLGRDIKADRSRVEEFHERMDGILYFTDEAIHEYARLRALLETQGTPISSNDLWIAAQALAEDAVLVSANTREFERVPGLRLEVVSDGAAGQPCACADSLRVRFCAGRSCAPSAPRFADGVHDGVDERPGNETQW